MKWVERKIGELLKLQRGHDLPSAKRNPGSIPIISSSGITDYHDDYKADGEGVVTGRYGTLGKVFYVKGKYWPLNTSLYVKDFKGNHPKFIYYFLKSIHLERYNGAAAVPGIDRNVIHRLKVKFPIEIYTQKKIASILSVYDDLIDNNNQRIELLEEMAEEIYKEWFVRLRFPGYQDSNFFDKEGKGVPHDKVGALPTGWKRKRINDLVSELGRGPSLNYEIPEVEGVPVLNQSCIRNGVIELQKVLKSENVYKNKPECYLKSNDILVNSMGEGTLGRVSRNVQIESDQYIIHNCITYMRANEEYSQHLLYYLTKQNQSYFIAIAQGSTGQSTLKKELIGKIQTFIPKKELMRKFDEIVEPMWKEVGLLLNKNEVLIETRDLLLPRLISGKLSAENINLENKTTMAAEPESEYKN